MFSGILGKKNERFPCVRVGLLSSRSHFCLRIVGSTIGQMRFQTVHNLTNGRDHLILLIFENFEEHVLRWDDESGCYVRIRELRQHRVDICNPEEVIAPTPL